MRLMTPTANAVGSVRNPLHGGYFCARDECNQPALRPALFKSGAFMLTYLYIAVGGAMGSVARAWMAGAVARALGPHFPWGTIFINILGSFVIGFFGALTAADGRFSAHPDARAFVMVGICGGFTTFSSFSLQTLDLARDGKLGAAFANIALSVVLCLLAVTAGYGSAVLINKRVP